MGAFANKFPVAASLAYRSLRFQLERDAGCASMDRATLTRELVELNIKETLSSKDWMLVCDESFQLLFREWEIDPRRVVQVDDIGEWGNRESQLHFAVVCTERAEGPTRNLLRESGVASAGLYSQIVPKLAAGLRPRFHPSPDGKADLEYAIMCLPRCGSTLVSTELRQIGAGNPVEHFRGYVHKLLRERETSRFDLVEWWSLVRNGRNINGIFGTKIIYGFWKMAEEYMIDEEKEYMLKFLKSVPIIYIERSDKIAQAVSNVIARRTGVWHLWRDDMKQPYQDKLREVDESLASAVASYKRFVQEERELAAFIGANAGSVIKIDYEDLASDPKEAIAAAAQRLGLTVSCDYSESDLSLRPTGSETHEFFRERLEAELKGLSE